MATGRTGYTPIPNSDPMQGPSQISDVYAWFDARIDLSVANYSSLPTTGNWKGRRAITEDTGWLWWNSDGGTGWKRIVSGKNPVYPSSVTGGTINADGSVSVTAATSLVMNGLFTSAFSTYEIDYDLTALSDAAQLFAQLTVGGTAQTSAVYSEGFLYNTTTGATGTSSVATSWQWGVTGTTYRKTGTVKLYDPAVAIVTHGRCEFADFDGGSGNTFAGIQGLTHGTTVAADGLSLVALKSGVTKTFTGRFRVYGLA
jgi:hypothetical protein